MNEVINNDDKSKSSNVKLIYILYLVSIVVGITSIIGVIMAYINKDGVPDWLKSHYQFQIRTFWIGLLYGLIGMVLLTVVVGILVLLFVLIWYIVRCVKGMNALDEGQAIANPKSWLF